MKHILLFVAGGLIYLLGYQAGVTRYEANNAYLRDEVQSLRLTVHGLATNPDMPIDDDWLSPYWVIAGKPHKVTFHGGEWK